MGYFVLHQQRWFLVNESMPDLKNAKTGEAISIGGKVELEDGLRLAPATGKLLSWLNGLLDLCAKRGWAFAVFDEHSNLVAAARGRAGTACCPPGTRSR